MSEGDERRTSEVGKKKKSKSKSRKSQGDEEPVVELDESAIITPQDIAEVFQLPGRVDLLPKFGGVQGTVP